MSLPSLQVCMDSSDWLQGKIHEESGGMDSSPSPCGDMIACSRPLIERRLRPQHDQALNCPRCDSTHTKFCYYNNYSLSQPRYFCKTCRRYWTKGGTLRNIPVGGGCRKNKKVSSSKKSNEAQSINNNQNPTSSSSSQIPTDLHLSFPDHHNQVHNLLGNPYFNGMLENPNSKLPIDFMVGNSRNYDFMGNGDMAIGGFGEVNNGLGSNYNFCNPYGISLDGNSGNLIDTCQRLMLPYDGNHEAIDMKPNTKRIMTLDWQDQGYINNVGSWSNMMHGYGPSTTNPLV